MALQNLALRPLRIGEILDVAIKLYRANFLTLVKAVLIFVLPTQILSALITSSLRDESSGITTGFTPETVSSIDVAEVIGVAAGAILVALLGIITAQLAAAASFRALSGSYLGEAVEWRETLRFALSKIWPLLWLGFLHGLLLGLGFLLLIVPGIYLYAAFSVAVPILLLEDVRGSRALGRSRSLVKGRWWPVAAVLLLTTLLSSIVQAGVSGLVLAASFGAANEIVSDIVGVIAATAAALITTPFAAAVSLVLYVDLRVRKEGVDLELLAAGVGADPGDRSVLAGLLPQAPLEGLDPDDEPPFWPPPPGWRPRSEQ